MKWAAHIGKGIEKGHIEKGQVGSSHVGKGVGKGQRESERDRLVLSPTEYSVRTSERQRIPPGSWYTITLRMELWVPYYKLIADEKDSNHYERRPCSPSLPLRSGRPAEPRSSEIAPHIGTAV